MPKKVKKNYDNILPSNRDLLEREKIWFKLFDKYNDCSEENELNLSAISDDGDGNNEKNGDAADDDDNFEESESEFESAAEEDPDFDVKKTADEAMKIIKKRTKKWPKEGVCLMLTSLPNNCNFNNWQKQQQQQDNNFEMHHQQVSVKNKIVKKKNQNCSTTSIQQTHITTMTTIQRHCVMSSKTTNRYEPAMQMILAADGTTTSSLLANDPVKKLKPRKENYPSSEKELNNCRRRRKRKFPKYRQYSDSDSDLELPPESRKLKQNKSNDHHLKRPTQYNKKSDLKKTSKVQNKKQVNFDQTKPALKKKPKQYPPTPCKKSGNLKHLREFAKRLSCDDEVKAIMNESNPTTSDDDDDDTPLIKYKRVQPIINDNKIQKKKEDLKNKETFIISDESSDEELKVNNLKITTKTGVQLSEEEPVAKLNEDNNSDSDLLPPISPNKSPLNDTYKFDAVDFFVQLDKKHNQLTATTTTEKRQVAGSNEGTLSVTDLDTGSSTHSEFPDKTVATKKKCKVQLEKLPECPINSIICQDQPLRPSKSKNVNKFAMKKCKVHLKKLSSVEIRQRSKIPIDLLSEPEQMNSKCGSDETDVENFIKKSRRESNKAVEIWLKSVDARCTHNTLKESNKNNKFKSTPAPEGDVRQNLSEKAPQSSTNKVHKKPLINKKNNENTLSVNNLAVQGKKANKAMQKEKKLHEIYENNFLYEENDPSSSLIASASKPTTSDYVFAKPSAVVFPQKKLQICTNSCSTMKSFENINCPNHCRRKMFSKSFKWRHQSEAVLFYDPNLPSQSVRIDEHNKTSLNAIASKIGTSDLSLANETISEVTLNKTAQYFYLPPDDDGDDVNSSSDDSDQDILDTIRNKYGQIIVQH